MNATKPKQPLPPSSVKPKTKTTTTHLLRNNPTGSSEPKTGKPKSKCDVIVGRIVTVDTHHCSKCCKNCTKTDFRYNKKSIDCKSCGTKYSDESELGKRYVTEITLKTEDKKTVKKNDLSSRVTAAL